MPSLFAIGDTHFHHYNIMREDFVLHLGDVSLGSRPEIQRVVEQLNGRKILVLGNHDRCRSVTFWKDCGFESVYKWIFQVTPHYFCTHEPLKIVDEKQRDPETGDLVLIWTNGQKERIKIDSYKKSNGLYLVRYPKGQSSWHIVFVKRGRRQIVHNIHGHLHTTIKTVSYMHHNLSCALTEYTPKILLHDISEEQMCDDSTFLRI